MSLLDTMRDFRHEASWAVWDLDHSGSLTGDLAFPMDQAIGVVHGRSMFVSLNPATDRASQGDTHAPDWANFHSTDRRHNDIFLARALVGTDFWGAYMTDLHPDIRESNSRLVPSGDQQVESAVRSLITQARLLAGLQTIVCVGTRSYQSISKHAALIEAELGLAPSHVIGIPHYSGAAAKVHRNNAVVYAELVRVALEARAS